MFRVDLWTEEGLKTFSEQLYEQPVSIDKLLEIEPIIFFLVERDDNKPTTLHKDPNPQNRWIKTTFTGITESNGSISGGSFLSYSDLLPSTYHQE